LFAGATVVLTLAMRRAAYGKTVVALGMTTAGLDVAAGYPDAIRPVLTLVCQGFFTAWFVAVGVKLYGWTTGTGQR
jgi:hypothetical protein